VNVGVGGFWGNCVPEYAKGAGVDSGRLDLVPLLNEEFDINPDRNSNFWSPRDLGPGRGDTLFSRFR